MPEPSFASLLASAVSTHQQMTDLVFTVRNAGDDCWVLTCLSNSLLQEGNSLVAVFLLNRETRAQIRMLTEASPTALSVYAATVIAVSEWELDPSERFPFQSDNDATTEYYNVGG